MGIDPYVTARMGLHCRHIVRTGAVRSTHGNDHGTNVEWTANHKNVLKVDRYFHDHGILVLDVYDEDLDGDDYIGGCKVDITPYLNPGKASEQDTTIPLAKIHKNSSAASVAIKSNRSVDDVEVGDGGIDDSTRPDADTDSTDRVFMDDDGWVTQNFALVDDGDEVGGDAGLIHARLKWVAEAGHDYGGYLMIHCVRGVELKNVDVLIVKDMNNFNDAGALILHLGVWGVYMLVGIVFCTAHLRWGLLDSIIFLTTTFTTVGYGNHPDNFAAPGFEITKMFFSCYIIFGVGLLGAIAGVVGSSVAQAMRRAEANLDIVELSTENLLREANAAATNAATKAAAASTTLAAIGNAAANAAHEVEARAANASATVTAAASNITGGVEQHMVPDDRHGAAEMAQAVVHEKRSFLRKARFPLFSLVATIMTGAVVYALTEDLNYLDAVYFTVVTTSTTGYGDYVPSTWPSKLFTIIYLPMAVCMLAYACHTIATIPMQLRHTALQEHVLNQFSNGVSEAAFSELKRSVHKKPSDVITRNDFSLAMLSRLGIVSTKDLSRVEKLFSLLDKDHSGELNMADITMLVEEQREHLAKELSLEAAEHGLGQPRIVSQSLSSAAPFEAEEAAMDNPLSMKATRSSSMPVMDETIEARLPDEMMIL